MCVNDYMVCPPPPSSFFYRFPLIQYVGLVVKESRKEQVGNAGEGGGDTLTRFGVAAACGFSFDLSPLY